MTDETQVSEPHLKFERDGKEGLSAFAAKRGPRFIGK